MNSLKQQFLEETGLSFDNIPINGTHVKYIKWLEDKITELPSKDNIDHVIQLLSWHYDPDADFEDFSPDDAVAHCNGLCLKLLNKSNK